MKGGDSVPDRQLTDRQVEQIRSLYVKGARPPEKGAISALAKKYGVSPFTISDIVKHRTYRHLLKEGESVNEEKED